MSFAFENMSRIGNDSCSLDQESIQNIEACNYLLQNYFIADCGSALQSQIQFATSQPGVFYSGSTVGNTVGCNVDDNSKLSIGSTQTHPKCRIDLFQRPFATIPYLGRGSVNPILEAQIQQGETFTNRRSVNQLGEKNYAKYYNTPLLPDVKDRVTNPDFCIEDSASSGWVRGGVPSRELTRDNLYFSS
jgi:hypothetical protein